jgi:hypothetical protein
VKKAFAIVTLFAASIAPALSQSLTTPVKQDKGAHDLPASPHYIFHIPVFPGTELFNTYPDLEGLNPPFGTIMEVFHTKDGEPLDKETVISFFHDALEHNGWKEGIFKRQKDEGYLSMRTDVFEALPDGTRIQVAGEFYLWLAPRDGMITVFLRQWRISSPGQATYNSLQAMVNRLVRDAPKAGYRAQKVYSDSGWQTDYENEYLVDRVLYGLIPADAQPAIDAPEGTLTVALLVYRDADVAAGEKARWEKEFSCSRCNVAVKGKIVVIVEGFADKEKRESILSDITLP